MKAPVPCDQACESIRHEIVRCGRECEAALHRAAMFEEKGYPRTAAISRERAVTAAHNAEIAARALARFQVRCSTLLINPGEIA